jgi:hypothetical protein
MRSPEKYRKSIRIMLVLFIIALILSGITAFPLEWETSLLKGHENMLPDNFRDMLGRVREGVVQTNRSFPFMAYGTDWLAFSHIVIALFFLPVYRNPVAYRLNVDIGIGACILIFPLAFCCGPVRHIPFFWQLIDCSFGFFGGVLLLRIRNRILALQSHLSNSPTHHP